MSRFILKQLPFLDWTWWRTRLPLLGMVGVFVVAGAVGAALRAPAQQQSGGSLTSPYTLRCTLAGGDCTGKVGGQACGAGNGGVCAVVVDYDNCPAGPNGPVCHDQFGVVVSCANPTQADADNDRRGDICDTCSDSSANGVVTISTADQWNASGTGVTGNQQINTVACTRNDALIDFSRPCTDTPFSCGADRFCAANDQRCSNDRSRSCIRDQDCQNVPGAGSGTCEQYCHANTWCDDSDGGIKIEKSTMPTPYVWVPLSSYNDNGSDAVLQIRTDIPLSGTVDASASMRLFTGLVGDAPRSLGIDLENQRVWIGNALDNTVSLLGYQQSPAAIPLYSLLQCPSGQDPRGIALDTDGNLFALGSGQYWGGTGWVDASGGAIGRLYQHQAGMAVCPAPRSTVPGVRANAAATDSRGNLWVADRQAGLIRQIRLSDGQLLRSIPVTTACAPSFGPNASAAPYGIAIDQFDNVWATCWGAAEIGAGADFGSCRANLDIPCRTGVSGSGNDPYGFYHDCAADARQGNFDPGGIFYSSRDYDPQVVFNAECCTPASGNCAGSRKPYIAQSVNRIVMVDVTNLPACQTDNDCYAGAPAGTCIANRCNHVVRGVEVPLASVPVADGGTALKYCSTDERVQCQTDANCPVLNGQAGRCLGAGVLGQPRGIAVDLNNAIWFTDGNWLSSAQAQAYPTAPGIVQRLRPVPGDCNLSTHRCVTTGVACDVDDQCRVADRFAVGNVPINVSVDANNDVWVMNQFGGGPQVRSISNPPALLTPSAGSITRLPSANLGGAVTYPTGGNPLTLSDATGLQRGMSVRNGSWETVLDSTTANTLWHRLALDVKMYDPARQQVRIQLHAAEQPDGFGVTDETWSYDQIRTESGAVTLSPLTLTGRFLHIKLTLRSTSRNSSPSVGNLTVNYGRCTQVGSVESSCNNNFDDDNDGYVDCADFDCRGQQDASGAICCGNPAAAGNTDNVACGACSVCGATIKEDVAYTSRGNNNINDSIYRCTPQADGADGNACTGPCTSCQSGACVNRPAGDQTECTLGCFACGGFGGGCTTIVNDGADTTGPGLCTGSNTCTSGVCAPPPEVCTDGINTDGDGYVDDCSDPDCFGQLGPGGVICCSNATQCGNNGVCQECISNTCQPTPANFDGNGCSGSCAYCDGTGQCINRAPGDALECAPGSACTAGTPGICEVVFSGPATLCVNSDGVGGQDAYAIFTTAAPVGFGADSVETPSTASNQDIYLDAPPHIGDEYSEVGIGNYFVFEARDGDCNRGDCSQDRSRIEVKAPTAGQNETYTYTWRMYISSSLPVFDSTFTHLHQVKADDCDGSGNNCNSNPVIALTVDQKDGPKMLRVENLNTGTGCDWQGGSGCQTAEVVPAIPLPADIWLDLEEHVTFNQAGAGNYRLTIKKVSDGSVLLDTGSISTPLWRAGRRSMRPKWGIYRGSNVGSGTVRFANFGITASATPTDDCRP